MGTRCANHVPPLYPQKLALTSPTGGGRSVGMVRSRTKATEFSLVFRNCNKIYGVRELLHQTGSDAFDFTNFIFELKFIISLRLIFFIKKNTDGDGNRPWEGGGGVVRRAAIVRPFHRVNAEF